MINKKKGLLLVLFTAVISGFSIFINSFAVKGLDSSVFTFSKNVIVALFLLSILFFFGQLKELKGLNAKQWSNLALMGLIGGSIPFLLFFKGLQITTGQTSAFIHKTIFIYVAIFAVIFLKERLTYKHLIAASLLMAGNFLLILPDFNFSKGHLLILLATVFWAAENVLAKKVLKELNGNIVAFGRMFFGSLFILLFLALTQKLPLIAFMSQQQYLWIIVTSLFLLLYVFTYYNGLKQIEVTTAACILSLGSVITALLNFLNGSSVNIMESMGMLLITLGIISLLWISHLKEFIIHLFKGETHERY